MLINILCLIIGIAATLIWIKVVKPKIALNYQEFAKDMFWLILTGLTIVGVAYLYFYLPQVFKWLAVDIWGVPASSVGEDNKTVDLQLADLGPLGDIYGSLNTLFTSATLAFVVYATLLQRQANKDARDAMAKQLSQARAATAKQLEQASKASKQQLEQAKKALDAQLKQAREANMEQIINSKNLSDIQLEHEKRVSLDQIALAKAAHREQLKASQLTIFNDKFFSFLKFKKDNLDNLLFYKATDDYGEIKISSEHLLRELSSKIVYRLQLMSSSKDTIDVNEIESFFLNQCLPYFEDFQKSSLHSYFLNYEAIIKMVLTTGLDKKEQKDYLKIISNSMTYDEQVVLFFIGPTYHVFMEFLKDSELFVHFSGSDFNEFAKKFYDESYFSSPYWKHYFNFGINKNSPA